MATEVVMPQMGESIAEGTITRWLVKVGESVERDQPLFEISTDKVDAEIPSPASGTLIEVRHEEGETVPVNEVVALIGEAGEGSGDGAGAKAEESAEDEKAAAPKESSEDDEAAEDDAEEAEDGEDAAAAEAGAEDEDAEADGDEEAGDETEADGGKKAAAGEESLEDRVRRTSSPVVRKMAKAEGVDLTEVEGTGIHGRVTKKDMEAHLETRGEAAPKKEAAKKEAPKKAASAPAKAAPAPKAGAPAPSTKVDTGFHVPAYTEGEAVEIEPMSKIRQITAAHMRYSKDTSAHVTTVFHIDMSNVHQVRERAKKNFLKVNGTKLTYMPFIFKAVAGALKRHKQINAAIDGTNVVYKQDINLGMAVAMDRGLLVPVLRNADQLSLLGLARTANDLADRARSKKLGPDELRGGTFTITNPGVFGSLFGTPIINQPQVAIMGIGAIEKRPVVVSGEHGNDMIAIKTMSYFAITYDHRLVDGADADHFMNDVKKTLEEDTWGELEPYR